MNPQSQAQGASPAHRGSREPVHSQGCRAASLRRPRWVNSNQLSPLLQGGSEPQDGGKAGEPAEGGIECATPQSSLSPCSLGDTRQVTASLGSVSQLEMEGGG